MWTSVLLVVASFQLPPTSIQTEDDLRQYLQFLSIPVFHRADGGLGIDAPDGRLVTEDIKLLRFAPSLVELKLGAISDADLRHIAKLKSLKSLEIRGFTGTGEGFGSFKNHAALREVIFSGRGLTTKVMFTSEGIQALSAVPGIESLTFRHVGIADEEIAELRAPRLRKLEVHSEQLIGPGMWGIASQGRLETLVLQDVPIREFGWLQQCNYLRDLTIVGCPINDEELAHIHHLKHLRSVKIVAGAVTDSGLDVFDDGSPIESLSIWQCRITDTGLLKLAKCPNLHHLQLADSAYTSHRRYRYLFFPLTTRIRTFRTCEGITDLGVEAFNNRFRSFHQGSSPPRIDGQPSPGATSFVRDKALRVSAKNSKVTLRGLEVFEIRQLKNAHDLRSLDLSESLASDRELNDVGSIDTLQELNLEHTWIEDLGHDSFSRLKDLRKLNLARTRITDDSMDAIAKLRGLEELHIGRTAITGDSIKKLAQLDHLHTLSLHGRSDRWHHSPMILGPVGIGHLSRLRSLEVLDIHGCVIGNGDLHLLADIPNLEELHLSSNGLSKDAVDELRTLMPQASVVANGSGIEW
ncbi:MAG: hypothetical protein QGG36_03735 [Pirellulaceae bacterium]|jgi:hypothetical protein|nr:hypothetical protein [Pirellulaceae bacterium]